MARNIAVTGIYRDENGAGEAVDALARAGFRATDSSILLPDNIGSKDFAHEKHSKAPEGGSIGALIGLIVGACCGWLIYKGTLSGVPTLSQIAAQLNITGAIGGVLTGMGAGGVLGLIIGALIGSGTPEYEAIRYEGRTRRGGVLLSAHCDNDDWVKRAKEILRETGARDIASQAEAKADFGASEKPLPRTRAAAAIDRRPRIREEVPVEDAAAAHDHAVEEATTLDLRRP